MWQAGWCLFEFASKLAADEDPAALGVAWKAFVRFGTRKDGFDVALYAEAWRGYCHGGVVESHF